MPDTASVHPQDETGFRATIRTRARDWDRRTSPLHAFGGRPLLDAELPVSALTGRALPLALDLDLSDPCLHGLGIHSIRRLAIVAPFGLALAPGTSLAVRHLDSGRRLELVREIDAEIVDEVPELPQLPVELRPLSEAEAAVDLVEDMPEGVPPLHQVGGRPVWMRAPIAAPRCPVSGEPMRFVASVASMRRFPLGDADIALGFGHDGEGMLYVFWSERAATSVAIVQSRAPR